MPKRSKVLRVNLKGHQKQQLLDIIKREMTLIAAEYEEKQFYQYLADSWQEYRGIKETTDFPVKNGSNRKLLLTTMMVDIVSHRGARQTDGANPMFLIEAEEKMEASEITERQNYLDFKVRDRINLPALHQIWYKYALLQRAAVVKLVHSEEIEYHKEETVYSKDNIAEFESKYTAELLNPKSKESEEHKRIEAGEEITKDDETEIEMYYGPKAYRVDLNKFYARLSIKDFNRQRVHGEEMSLSWADIEERYNSGFYDSDAVLEMIGKYAKDYASRPYRIAEFIVRISLKDELNEDGTPPKKPDRLRKYIVTYDIESEIILRCIHYPFRHNKAMYIDYSGFPSDETWWPESLYDRMEDATSIAEAFLNSMINSYTLAHMPIIGTTDPRFDGGRVVLDNLSVLKFAKDTQMMQFKYENPPTDALAFLQFIIHFSELVTGVIASLASGAETPGDSDAPAAKTAMKMRAGNMRMEDLITNLQLSDAKLAEQIDSLCLQYPKKENATEDVYYVENEKKAVSYATLGKRVRYICHGSRISFDKPADQQMIMAATIYMGKFFPQTLADAEVAYTLLSAYVNASEGSIEKNKHILTAPLKMLMDAKNEVKELLNTIRTQQGGKPTPEQQAMLQRIGESMKMMSGIPMAPPGQPQGQPPAGPGGHRPDGTGPHGAGAGPGGGRRDGSGMGQGGR